MSKTIPTQLTCWSNETGARRPCSPQGRDGRIAYCEWYCEQADGLVVGRDDARIAEIESQIGDAMLVIERDGEFWRCNGYIQDACGLSGGGHEMQFCEFDNSTEPTAWNDDRSGGVPTFRTWEEPIDDDDDE